MAGLNRTGLYDLHIELGARMVPFAGYEMPVQYPAGVMAEHLHTRAKAGLFDVSHMGQVILRGETRAAALETLVPVDVLGLPQGRQRYGFFTDDRGDLLDDLMIANRGDHLFIVVNAARKDHDIAHMQSLDGVSVEPVAGRALLALQGPAAEDVLAAIVPEVRPMRFMDVLTLGDLWISRSGYTGEDGFEISVPDAEAEALTRRLLADEDVLPIGLGARDSLRLEAGLCLYGADIDETTSPIEAGLGWAIGKVRRSTGAREGGFPGSNRILAELETGPGRKRVGLRPETRAPMRAGTELFTEDGTLVGHVTSGAYGPTVEAPVSMGYVAHHYEAEDTRLFGEVRGKRMPVRVAALPFTPARFKR
ncbi:MAG: glycine cleavage system aminomethyltransferase GcvT [Paracoccaceae bacterium]|nr:glycine cleavage system aminomethyltransferase GcvT [Paracoccaceae bacterium]